MTGAWHVCAGGLVRTGTTYLASLGLAALERGHPVLAWAQSESDEEEFRSASLPVRRYTSAGEVGRFARTEGAAALIAGSSLNAGPLLRELHGAGAPISCLESSWMPWGARQAADLDVVDRFLVTLPASVFERGLERNAGRCAMPRRVQERARAVGWFSEPVQEPPGDLVVLDFSGEGRPEGSWWSTALAEAVRRVAGARHRTRWVWVGDPGASLPPFVEVSRAGVEEPVRSRLHHAAALLVCGEDPVVVGRGAVSGARVMCLSDGLVYRHVGHDVYAGRMAFTLARVGVVEAVHGPVPTEALQRRVLALLDAGRADPSWGDGPSRAVDEIERLVVG